MVLPAYISVYVGTLLVCLVAYPSQCSVYMREEECRNEGSGGKKCADRHRHDRSVDGDSRQISILEVDEPKYSQQNVGHYTPLPFAAFMQPRPVFQGAEEKVFNVLEKERTSPRLLKGGKRHNNYKDVSEHDRDVSEHSRGPANEGEQVSMSHVNFRRRKGGKRSDRKKQLRKERIERKRAKRKERRKLKKKRRKMRRHPKLKNRKNKVKKNKLKSLNTRGKNRGRKNQVSDTAAILLSEQNFTRGQVIHRPPQLLEANKLPNEETVLAGMMTEASAVHEMGELNNPFNHHNYHQMTMDIEDYSDEDDETDNEYSLGGEDDYEMSPDYFLNWKDNASMMDYFSQSEGSTTSPESWLSDEASGTSILLDPSHITLRRHIIRLHNLLRSKVEPPAANMLALSWHGAAATQARKWADSCVAHRGRDNPSVRWTPRYGTCGQNVLVTRKKKRWAQVIRTWWSERRHFNYGVSDVNNVTYKARSYTQLVWYSSHKVGCGYSQCSTTSGRTFHRYVCNYCPAGNDPTRLSLPYTKGRSCEMCPKACRSVCPEGQCRLCTNRCPFSDLWANCQTLVERWRQWLCNTKTTQGVERFKNCRATCQCALSGDKII